MKSFNGEGGEGGKGGVMVNQSGENQSSPWEVFIYEEVGRGKTSKPKVL